MRIRIALVVAALAVTVIPAHARSVGSLDRFYAQSLKWQRCTKHLDCATFQVPLDYRKPDGRAITITAARNKAAGVSRGTLLMNPGGPGGSGIDYIEIASDVVSPAIHKALDLVSFDPRGLGRSTPLKCFNDKQTDAFMEVDQTPDSAAEEQALLASGRRLIRACMHADTQLMQHVSTAEVARDMDVLRALLGQQKLRYLGKSWGAALGYTYAALFPSRTGLVVLDGPVDLKLTLAQSSLQQATAFESAANRFIEWCLQQGSCVLGKTVTTARSRLIAFIKTLDAQPLRTSQKSRPLTEQQAWTAVIGPLYVALGGWDWLNIALESAIQDRDGTELQNINDWFIERSSAGKYKNNGNTLIYAVNCLDRVGSARPDQERSELAKQAKSLPLMGRLMVWGDAVCSNWPFKAQESLNALTVRNVPPMLIVGSTYDPATPMRWARAVQRQVPNSVLLERVGEGHTAYAIDSTCIDRAVDAYLLSRNQETPVLPPNGKRCV